MFVDTNKSVYKHLFLFYIKNKHFSLGRNAEVK